MSEFKKRQSYSIEAEDLLLDSIFALSLKQKKSSPGIYIDIGSAHPIEYSNTYFFYEKGWRGVCVEPNLELFALYEQIRPRDKAVNIGVSDGPSASLRYHRFTQPLINGFFGQDLINQHTASGEIYLGSIDVPCLSVQEFLTREVGSQQVDLLNIDVETMEARILGQWNWDLCRPKVICAEIHTKTISTMLSSDVVTVLTRAGYIPMSRGLISTIFVASELLA
jgi:FkbM family methyltransferase